MSHSLAKDKIMVLRGDLAHDTDHPYLDNLFEKYDIPVVNQFVPDFLHTHAHGDYHTYDVDIVTLDWRNWYFDNRAFEFYLRKVLTIKSIQAVRLSDFPCGYERPRTLSLLSFEKLLAKRTKMASKIIKNESEAVLLSPSIDATENEDIWRMYYNYFSTNSDHFYGYSFSYEIGPDTEKTDRALHFLQQIHTLSRKPVWILKWAVASSKNPIMPDRYGQHVLDLPSHKRAAKLLQDSFHRMHDITRTTKWFFTGAGDDKYTGGNGWIDVDYEHHGRGPGHFMGLLDQDKNPKTALVTALIDLIVSLG
jgi:hypothetical protein